MLKSIPLATVKLVKTLPHLTPIHLQQFGRGIYASSYSYPIYRFLAGAEEIHRDHIKFTTIRNLLTNTPGLNYVHTVRQVLDFNIQGDIINIWPLGYDHPIRLEFFGEDLEKIYSYDELYGRKLHDQDILVISSYLPTDKIDQEQIFINLEPRSDTILATIDEHTHDMFDRAMFVTHIPEQIPAEAQLDIIEHDYTYPPLFWNRLDLFRKEVVRLFELDYKVEISTKHPAVLPEGIFTASKLIGFREDLAAGFISASQKHALFTDREIFGTVYLNKQKDKALNNTSKLLQQFEGEISVGDYVVHEDYGVAVYAGLTQELIDGTPHDYLLLQYAEQDQLSVPVSQINKLTKFIGEEGLAPRLTRLGKAEWETLKQRVKRSVSILARELLEHYAKRQVAKAKAVSDQDSAEYTHFVAQFPYTETDDQLRATNEKIADMQLSEPMNRLLIGDVGFGKTEVMMRAAFKAVEAGMQVAVLCPTTVLAAQHYAVFSTRFKDFPVKIASLSRFNTAEANRELAEEVNKGKYDIVIGTHRILSNDVKFQKLGLLIVDEEQRFGVAQKEKIKQINYGLHHLAVSATPIPRTLSMALSSIQEISILSQAPSGRKPIHTELAKQDWKKIASVIQREVNRGGQVYFVHNRVQGIENLKAKLQELLPGLKAVVAHGQMPPAQLDRVITEFYQQQYQVLICTQIIENGLDMPNVNTIIINNAQSFGLAQLYQLRGRVGRSEIQAYCYMFYLGKKLGDEGSALEQAVEQKLRHSPNYLKRLEAIVQASELGSGFQISSRDLELRGAGNILGEQQHGHISSIGYALYMQILAQEVERLKAAVDAHNS